MLANVLRGASICSLEDDTTLVGDKTRLGVDQGVCTALIFASFCTDACTLSFWQGATHGGTFLQVPGVGFVIPALTTNAVYLVRVPHSFHWVFAQLDYANTGVNAVVVALFEGQVEFAVVPWNGSAGT
jgi:hypothetical protein